jgi:hypothetical protein
MIDDTPTKLAKHYGNLLSIKSFEGDLTDNELQLLTSFLEKLANVENVRRVKNVLGETLYNYQLTVYAKPTLPASKLCTR